MRVENGFLHEPKCREKVAFPAGVCTVDDRDGHQWFVDTWNISNSHVGLITMTFRHHGERLFVAN